MGKEVLSVALDSVAVIAIVVAVVIGTGLGALALRRRLLTRAGGAFTCALRRGHARDLSPRGWTLGVARFADESIEWFRVFSLSPRPRQRLDRRRLSIEHRRTPHGMEAYALPHDSIVLACGDGDGPVDLAMPQAAATGLLVWLEAVPPGAHSSV
ncbi:MAG TPA: DUF2550 domain-containing protein [Actinomycetes bacterium]|nr:DUF2550 domain-containing protein [Actinomycetes bacterium]